MSQNGETAGFDKAQPQDISVITGPVNRLDNPTDREQATILHGQEAWQRLRDDHTWEDWKKVGAAHLIGRIWAIHEAHVNRTAGARYKAAFAAWLKKFGFENLDKADRSRLFAVMDHLQEIEAWRATLTPAERLRLNHPSAVLRKWRAAHAISRSQNRRLSPIEKRSGREYDLCDPADRPENIATALIAKLSSSKAAAVAGAILKALEEKVAE